MYLLKYLKIMRQWCVGYDNTLYIMGRHPRARVARAGEPFFVCTACEIDPRMLLRSTEDDGWLRSGRQNLYSGEKYRMVAYGIMIFHLYKE